ncbi:NAD(P)-dependent glycerol-1-phosphate dehydrogenase [Salinarchaeum sp. Harcht-Bsk1]|uniref:NAD(P)-dependent glycerol-1-phosphate dehydrogenase n=1 Tax=Salinarchaeum sp. Harcht-Bsk1 TaxID=1333523 RepID=UPI00034242F4|nr:NAD(P)-dependent glycerol-1-phosphate dehydrogenase [Salinarchaeum sp. Harcht-Bsk1]AGN00211.1 NAD(P)-dependent glycerol-1-phosphate dehydrogenase [Salinarchaeum sp. Harcht-Bsk1]
MFDKSTWIRLPRNVVVGHGVVDDTVEAVADLHLHGQPLIVTSPTPRELAAERIAADFAADGEDPVIVEVQEANFDAIEHVIDRAREVEPGFLIGVGGGKPIDIAKMAAEEIDRGFVSVPTAASHDGIVSGRASVPDQGTRHSIAAEPPLAVVADTEILADAPWELTTAGCADIISNYTAVLDWRLARRLKNVSYSEYGAALSEMTAEILVDNADSVRPGLEESAWVVVKALVSSGVAMSIAGSSRPASGAEHLFSHQLDRIAPGAALHGHQAGVGSIVTAYLHAGERGMWSDIRNALDSIDAPTTAADLGVSDEQVVEALTTAYEIRDRYTILGDGLEESAARQAASYTGVI